jgi:hypothetical protein
VRFWIGYTFPAEFAIELELSTSTRIAANLSMPGAMTVLAWEATESAICHELGTGGLSLSLLGVSVSLVP